MTNRPLLSLVVVPETEDQRATTKAMMGKMNWLRKLLIAITIRVGSGKVKFIPA